MFKKNALYLPHTFLKLVSRGIYWFDCVLQCDGV